jgi:outer membrane protein assembly factor BamB
VLGGATMKQNCVTKIAVAFCAACLCAAGSASGDSAEEILETTGVDGGLVVHVGCVDGRLTAALGADERFVVHGLDADSGNVAKARMHIRSLGLQGRVSVDRLRGEALPYADNLANLVVSEDLGAVPPAEAMRVLAPRGVAYIQKNGAWEKTIKPWPEEMDEWTHWRHAADGNMVSKDRLVGPPRYAQWVAGPLWQRHHAMAPSITTMVSARGRIFYIADEAPMGVTGLPGQWRLIARDAFNGLPLWKRPIEDWGSEAWSYWTEGHSARFNHPIHIRKRLVAVGDRVYATLGFNAPVSALDAVTGETVMTYEGTQYTDEIVLHDGVLFLAVNDRPQKPLPGKGVDPAPSEIVEDSEKRIWAVDAATGDLLWKSRVFSGKKAKPDRMASMKHLGIVACEKGVFFVDESDVVCLDRETGEQRWAVPRLFGPEGPEQELDLSKYYHSLNLANLHNVLYYQGVVIVVHPGEYLGVKWSKPAVVQALSPESGEEIWRYEATPINYIDVPDALGADGLIWLPKRDEQTVVGLDPATGREERVFSIEKALDVSHHHRCYPNRATENYLIVARRGAEFVDLTTGEITLNHWARAGCRYGHMTANGLLYKPPDYCRCYKSAAPRGFYALASEERGAKNEERRTKGEEWLERGPAYGDVKAPKASAADWPTFRGDPLRSGAARSAMSGDLEERWRITGDGPISAPTIAGGKVFFASTDAHTVHALDEESGETVWTYTVGGRVDSPPTIHRGMAIFGSADGWVYALRAKDGELAWRFRAAPAERRIMAFGQVESAWPVHGSVLAVDGVVFCLAGRASVVDGGVYTYALDAATGEILEQKQIHEIQTETKTTGELPEGALSDILLTDGASVYLRNRELDFATPIRLGPNDAFSQPTPRLVVENGFLDAQWFHRVRWKIGTQTEGNLIVYDGKAAYAAASNNPGPNNQTFYIPSGGTLDRIIGGPEVKGPRWLTELNIQQGGYLLFSAAHKNTAKDARAARRSKPDVAKPAARWRHEQYPICPWAMVVAGPTLFVAGFPDEVDPGNPWATFEGRRGGILRALSSETGETIQERLLDSPPVWNGMAAANNHLYVSTRDGALLCFGEK